MWSHPTPGVGLGIIGIAVGIVPFALEGLGVTLPPWAFVVLLVLALVLFMGGVALEVRAHRKGTPHSSLDLSQAPVRSSEPAAFADALGAIGQDTRRDFMDELGRLREEGRALRRAIELPPIKHPTRGVKETALRGSVLVGYEDKADDWARRVRAVIDRHAPRFVVLFDQGSWLPERDFSMLLTMTPRGTRAQLEAFLKLRLQHIDRIMAALHASDT
jgi:hypothetical protein